METFTQVVAGIQELVKNFFQTYNRPPSTLNLTVDDEAALASGSEEEMGAELYSNFQANGARVAFGKMYGADVVWDAAERSVE